MTFQALLASKTGDRITSSVVSLSEQELMPGDLVVDVDYSTVNYKDALAITGRADVIRQFPLIPGIDFAGTVKTSSYPGIAVRTYFLSPDAFACHLYQAIQPVRKEQTYRFARPGPLSNLGTRGIRKKP